MATYFSSDHIQVQRKENRLPPRLNGNYEKTSFFSFKVLIYLRITISHLFVYLPTLELTTFEQQLRSTKKDYANALSLGTNRYKKKNVTTLNSTHQAKRQCKFYIPIFWVECSINDLKQQDFYFDIFGWV